MEKDKRPFYVWMFVLIANIFVASYFYTYFRSGYDFSVGQIAIILFIFFSIVPVLISRYGGKRKSVVMYSVSIILLVLAFISLNAFLTCSGGWCDLYLLISLAFVLITALFIVFYAIDFYARKKDINFILTFVWTAGILTFLFFGRSLVYFFFEDLPDKILFSVLYLINIFDIY